MNITHLYQDFPADKIHWRVGATTKDKSRGIALAYLDARDVMDRFDEACGPDNWQVVYSHVGAKVCCQIGVKIAHEWIWKANGAGDTDFEGDKGSFSDAFKRAAVLWGVGRYLYSLDAPWVEIEPAGRSYKIKQNELAKLRGLLDGRKIDETDLDQFAWDFMQQLDHCKTRQEFEDLWTSNKTHIGRMRNQKPELYNEFSKEIHQKLTDRGLNKENAA